MSEAEQLLKLIDGHIDVMSEGIDFNKGVADSTRAYFAGMKSIRWLVYNFFNAPRNDDIEDAGTKDFGL